MIDGRGMYIQEGARYCEVFAKMSAANPDVPDGSVALVVDGDDRLWRFRSGKYREIELPADKFADVDEFMGYVMDNLEPEFYEPDEPSGTVFSFYWFNRHLGDVPTPKWWLCDVSRGRTGWLRIHEWSDWIPCTATWTNAFGASHEAKSRFRECHRCGKQKMKKL